MSLCQRERPMARQVLQYYCFTRKAALFKSRLPDKPVSGVISERCCTRLQNDHSLTSEHCELLTFQLSSWVRSLFHQPLTSDPVPHQFESWHTICPLHQKGLLALTPFSVSSWLHKTSKSRTGCPGRSISDRLKASIKITDLVH